MSAETPAASDPPSPLAAAAAAAAARAGPPAPPPRAAPHAAEPAAEDCEASLAGALRRCAAVIQATYRSQVARLDAEWRLRTSQLERDNRALRRDVANLETLIAADSRCRAPRREGSADPAGGEESEIARLTAEIAVLKQREEKWKFKSASVRKWAEEEIRKYKAKAAEDKKRVDEWKRFIEKNMRSKDRRRRGKTGPDDNGDGAEFGDPVSPNGPAGSGDDATSAARASDNLERTCLTKQSDDCRRRSRSASRKKPKLRRHELVFGERPTAPRKRNASPVATREQSCASGELRQSATVSPAGAVSGVSGLLNDPVGGAAAQNARLDQAALIAGTVVLRDAFKHGACDGILEENQTAKNAIARNHATPPSGVNTRRSGSSARPSKTRNRGRPLPDGAGSSLLVCDESDRCLSCADESSGEDPYLLVDVRGLEQRRRGAPLANELPEEHRPVLTSPPLVGPVGAGVDTRPPRYGLLGTPQAVDERGGRPGAVSGSPEPEASSVRDPSARNTPDDFARPSRYPRSYRRRSSGMAEALRLGDHYKFDEVVRGKHARRHLHGVACDHCIDFYRAAGILRPAVDPQYVDHRHHHNLGDGDGGWATEADDEAFFQDRIQKVSRHRHLYLPPSTPPRFWDIGFPTSQEINDAKDRRIAEETRAACST